MTERRPLFTYRDGEVAVVVLNRPASHNAIGTPLLTRLKEAVAECSSDAGAIVLASEGTHFSVGADLVEVTFAWGDRAIIGSFLSLFHDVADAIAVSSVPIIAAVQGLALAGGLELALACDLVVAADDAEFGDQHINVELIPGGGGSQRLPRAVGARRALALQMTGDRIDAHQALSWGLVHSVHPKALLRKEAVVLAKTIAARDRSSVRHIRELGRVAASLPLSEGLAIELSAATDHISSSPLPDALSGYDNKTKDHHDRSECEQRRDEV
ncbi:MAG TPA: enoyl-CoA hydratase/isomerase family protein [Acidimicrobiales bacterium]|nr:enoyl-CoA hydratase/isomerase family protein [Acidimicrobiales bacterium]